MQNNTVPTQDNEINLRELWATLVKRKLSIFTVTAITTISAAVYAWMATPIYSGEVLIEIGSVILNSDSVNDKPTIIQSLDSAADLKEVISQAERISVDTPKGSVNLIKISYEGTDREQIKQKLESVLTIVLNRHESKAEFFQIANAHIRPSAMIGSINVTLDPIKPKKQLIVAVALISGLILGIFLAFFMEFIQNGKTRREE